VNYMLYVFGDVSDTFVDKSPQVAVIKIYRHILMIIHINGVSGSGKSTLGAKLAKHDRFWVVDSDDIDDRNAMILLDSNKKIKDIKHFRKLK